MKASVLIGCEQSGVVRDAFRRRGFDAWSCDLEGVEAGGQFSNYHLYGDVRWFLDHAPGDLPWSLAIFHPPCRYLAVSGARHFASRRPQQEEALQLVRDLLAAPIPRIALENPVSIISTRIRPASQWIQPWMFGHGETKKTGLWLTNLPPLVPTNIVPGREARVHRMAPSPHRSRLRSTTYTGIAEAMAEQWGGLL